MVTTLAGCAERPAGQVSRAMRGLEAGLRLDTRATAHAGSAPVPPEAQRALLTLGHATRDTSANARLGHAAQNSSQRPVFGHSSMTRAVAVLWTTAAPLTPPTSSRRRI